ncbi:MAG: thioredoxin [Candidatus Symbiothrix sp.]|jgi:thioredoxin 1|nr:thioredoxin [Candidatus Symbiothrix sp.]
MAKQVTDTNFKELLNGDKPLVVDFWAEWCGPCKMIGPSIDELHKEYEGKVEIGKCNVDENMDLPAEFGIRSIPTILFFKGGQIVDKIIGAAGKDVIDAKIKALL